MARRSRHHWPFLGGGVIAFAALPLGTLESSTGHVEVLIAALLFAAIGIAAALGPWERLPRLLVAAPLVASFAVIALLRDAEGGAISGYGTLVLLPVFWIALYAGRREVVASVVAVAGFFVVPILAVGTPAYPPVEWRRALLWVTVTAIVGLTTQGIVARVRASARVDPLTQVANRRAWEERLALALKLADRSGLPVSIGLLDLDGFKRYNDAHGHGAGDRLLVRAAAAWAAQVREADLLGRLGGDEFAILLPGATLAEAEEVAARVRLATPDVRCSAGVAEWDQHEGAQQLVARADRLLYADKVQQKATSRSGEPGGGKGHAAFLRTSRKPRA